MKKILTLVMAIAVGFASAAVVNAMEMTDYSELAEKKPSKKKREIKEVTFNVHIHCENCVQKIQENIAFEKGVKDMKVSLEDQTVMLKYDTSKTSEEKLKAAIEELGYQVNGHAGHEHHHHSH